MKEIFNLPNILSFFRLLLVPLFILSFFYSTDGTYAAALIIFLVASFTDLLDGILARSLNQITALGVVLDPLADKLLKMSALICFGIAGVIPLWLVISVVAVDILMKVAGTFLFKREITIPSNFWGKLGTFTMTAGILLCFFVDVVNPWNLCVLYAGLIIIILSVIVYIILNFREVIDTLKGKHRNKKEVEQKESKEN